MRRYLPFVIIGGVLLITLGSGYLLLRFKTPSAPISVKVAPSGADTTPAPTEASVVPATSRVEPASIPAKLAPGSPGAEPAHVRGAATARVTLEEFGDFQCTQCGAFSTTLKKIEEDYGSRLRVIFREYPLHQHEHAYDAACAAEAAGLQGRFWEMHDLLYENASEWNKGAEVHMSLFAPRPLQTATADIRAIFNSYAEKLGLDVERFKQDMDGEEVKARISLDRERVASLGIDRTPTLYINGQHVPATSRTLEDLRPLIDAELAGEKK